MLLQLTALTMSHHSLTHCVHISSSSVQTLVHDLQTIHLGSLVGGDCVETEESEADVLDQQRQAHRHHPYPGLGVDLYGGPAAPAPPPPSVSRPRSRSVWRPSSLLPRTS